MPKPLLEETTLEAPRFRDVHTEEECDRMLALSLNPEVRDAWLDERLSCMRARVSDRPDPDQKGEGG